MMKWNWDDTVWVLGLFGTAVGAGILFLPINLGINGIFTVVVLGVLAFPMTYFSHKALCHFVLSSEKKSGDITDVAEEHFGKRGGQVLTWLYFMSIYPILLIYAIGATNTIDSLLVHQLGFDSPARWLLSLFVVFSMVFVILFDEDKVIRVTSYLVYPLIATLFFLSIYLIPKWDLSLVFTLPDAGSFLNVLWISVPVIIFSFNHSPVISSFAKEQHQLYGDRAREKSDRVLKYTAIILLMFVMFFVISCILALSPEMLAEAKTQNISVMSYMANVFGDPFLNIAGPLIALTAIISSFFGHYLGAKEGLKSILTKESKALGFSISEQRVNRIVLVFFISTLWLAAYLNPSILSLMQKVSGPITAVILFIMPVYAFMRIKKLNHLLQKWRHIFILILGLIAVSSLIGEFWR